jgi:signal transduction histidine kinase/HPt (histidine-containing phosphotransfer) domain-containing protein
VLVTIEGGENHPLSKQDALLSGRVAILYALSRYSLFLPFASLCMAACLMERPKSVALAIAPLFLLVGAALCAHRLRAYYDRRGENQDPRLWAYRYTILSGIAGGIWGAGAFVWFVPGSFPAQAYLVLAFLGVSAVEFVARAAYRPAYLAHAAGSLVPLAALLIHEGGTYQMLTAVLVLFFGGTLYNYSGRVAELLDESILLRHDNAGLIRRLSEEKQAAERIRDAAQASERAKSAFVANISHELRTPLNAILGMAQLLERSDLVKAQRDHVKVLLESSRGLKTLLDDIIALSQETAEPSPSADEGCDAAQAVRTVARLLQPNAWEKRLRLSINIAPGLPRAAADPRLFRRVVLKLAGNAIKFTERGNIEMALDTVSDAAGASCVRFTVTDTGPGIPHHLLATIIEPFTKNDDSYATRNTGAGIGLAVAKRLIESIGGAIGVESEPGMGARFWIEIPTVTSATIEECASEDHAAPPSGLSLLAYLPDETMRSSIERLLTPFGNSISRADTLAESITMSARGSYALILAAAANVDAFAAVPGQRTPILALATAEERHPGGADAVLRWPSAPNALYAAITAVTGDGARPSENLKEDHIEAAIDAKAISDLEKSLGFKTLIDILQSYMHTADELAAALSATSDKEDWSQAGRLAQDFAGAAGGLGLSALTAAARLLAQGARDGADDSTLFTAAEGVLSEHSRVREALRRLYPDLAA